MCLFAILCGLLTINISGNSAEPPNLIIIADNAPEDFAVYWIIDETEINAQKNIVLWETYYSFYRYSMYDIFGDYIDFDKMTIKIHTNNETFTIDINSEVLDNSYNRVFTLDMESKALVPGKLLLRSIILVGLRVSLTLIIEGLIFLIFMFRQKRSWIAFAIINIITQIGLNIILNSELSPLISRVYAVFGLFIYEFIILIIEMIAFGFAVNEHKKLRVILYVLTANTASFILGGILISYLPV